jgi:hypothetical protein
MGKFNLNFKPQHLIQIPDHHKLFNVSMEHFLVIPNLFRDSGTFCQLLIVRHKLHYRLFKVLMLRNIGLMVGQSINQVWEPHLQIL